jgi:hypothetical protein
MSINPMQNILKAHAAPRCLAKSKRTGQRCKAPPVRGFRVCRMHGARGGAPEGKRSARRQVQGNHRALEVNQVDEVTRATVRVG